MKQVSLCQVSVMLGSNLPSNMDYNEFINEIMQNMEINNFSIVNPIPKEQWNQMPSEIPYAIGQSNEIDMQLSSVNLNLTLKKIDAKWSENLDSAISAIGKVCDSIGMNFNMPYRFGVIITAVCDKASIVNNAKKILIEDITNKKEWQISYLDSLNDGKLELNKWTRYVFNGEQNIYNYITDINTKAQNDLSLRDNRVLDIYSIVKTNLVGAYNEFEG